MNGSLQPISVEPMSRDDVADVLTIEDDSFSDPWTEELIARELDQPWSHAFVARDAHSEVVGYLFVWLVADELHVVNIATRQDLRGCGIGRSLLEHAVALARQNSVRLLTLEVRRSNAAAAHLYEELGFRRVAVRARYYSDTEDAIVMHLELKESGG